MNDQEVEIGQLRSQIRNLSRKVTALENALDKEYSDKRPLILGDRTVAALVNAAARPFGDSSHYTAFNVKTNIGEFIGVAKAALR